MKKALLISFLIFTPSVFLAQKINEEKQKTEIEKICSLFIKQADNYLIEGDTSELKSISSNEFSEFIFSEFKINDRYGVYCLRSLQHIKDSKIKSIEIINKKATCELFKYINGIKDTTNKELSLELTHNGIKWILTGINRIEISPSIMRSIYKDPYYKAAVLLKPTPFSTILQKETKQNQRLQIEKKCNYFISQIDIYFKTSDTTGLNSFSGKYFSQFIYSNSQLYKNYNIYFWEILELINHAVIHKVEINKKEAICILKYKKGKGKFKKLTLELACKDYNWILTGINGIRITPELVKRTHELSNRLKGNPNLVSELKTPIHYSPEKKKKKYYYESQDYSGFAKILVDLLNGLVK